MEKKINIGCGNRYHEDWTNIDFKITGEGVLAHNLLKGIPFEDNYFDVVYHSHVLEHFSKSDGKLLLKECYRILKTRGIFRCAVPDLEQIARLYLENLRKAEVGDKIAANNYEWMLLEMFDQTVRNFSGGEMAKYLYQDIILNEKFVFSRIGEEGKLIRNNYLKTSEQEQPLKFKSFSHFIKKIFNKNNWKLFLKKKLFADEFDYVKIGKFRMGGEIHQWMYDRYSLKKTLEEVGFVNIETKTAFESNIREWNKYELESKNGEVLKPDSLFIEAKK